MAKRQQKKRKSSNQKWQQRPFTQKEFDFLLTKLKRDDPFVASDDDKRDILWLMNFYRRHSRKYDATALVIAALLGASIMFFLLRLSGKF